MPRLETPISAYRGPDPYVFVCYAHEDASVVYPELAHLRDDGINVWYDEGISPGSEWTDELAHAIEHASHVLFFVSPRSVASRNCRNEIHYALEQHRPVLAVHLQPTELPGGLQLALGSAQAVRKHALSEGNYWRKLREGLGYPGSSAADASIREAPARRRTGMSFAAAVAAASVVLAIGYAFLSTDAPPALDDDVQASAPAASTIAVLPFVNLGQQADETYLGDGLAEEILNTLARTGTMRVVARTSSFRFRGQAVDLRELSERLGATHVLEGSVRQADDRVVVTTALIDTRDGTQAWSERYERSMSDVLLLQRNIADAVAGTLARRLDQSLVEARVISDEAYVLYLQAKQMLGQLKIEEAVVLLEQAIALEPEFLEAHVAIASALGDLGWGGSPEQIARFNQLLDRTLALDPDNPQAQIARVRLARAATNDRAKAVEELASIVRRHPNSIDALVMLAAELNPEQRLEVLRHARTIDPLNPLVINMESMAYAWTGRIEPAAEHMRKLVELEPDYPNARRMQVLLEVNLGNREAAGTHLEHLRKVAAPTDWVLLEAESVYARDDAARVDELSARLLSNPEVPRYVKAMTLLNGANDLTPVLDELEAAEANRDYNLMFIRAWVHWSAAGYRLRGVVEPAKRLEVHPRYRALLQRLGLDRDPWLENVASLWD